ncbi:2Fe-2S iron-sulfur cluster-binding protein [Paraburkholderia tropica]|uniref:2Fe-2S iron-sulfur cluster-binding protein n=1 Tax=Paraburkholderia tropica TaxID=92647 RepID=UPI0038B7B2E2
MHSVRAYRRRRPGHCVCEQGVCGSCQTAVLAGEPDHRDHVLSAGEKRANDRMMICCSRAQSATLELDI